MEIIGILLIFTLILVPIIIFRNGRKSKIGSFQNNMLHNIIVLLTCVIVSITLTSIRICPIIVKESKVLSVNRSFTKSFIEMEAYISEDVEKKHNYVYLYVKPLEDITLNETKLYGKDLYILVKEGRYKDYTIGMMCEFTGYIEVPKSFDDFDYKLYLKNKGIFYIMDSPKVVCETSSSVQQKQIIKNNLIYLKNIMLKIIDDVLNEPQSSLLAGILLGSKRLFSVEFEENQRIAGVSHIVSASGYNVTVLLLVVDRMFFFVPKRYRNILDILFIWLFAVFSGLSTSITRACIMSSVSLVALFFGRRNMVHISLLLTVTIFMFYNPLVIYDVGFLLSVGSMFGLVYVLPIITEWRGRFLKKMAFLDDSVLPTLACTLATLPITISTFGSISIWSVPANTVVQPVIGNTMLYGFLGILFYKLFPPVAYLFFSVVYVQLKYFELIINYIGGLSLGTFDISSPYSTIVVTSLLIILALAIVYFYPIENEKYNYYLKNSD
ncbi:ComEC/Rec2 family competence protein [bacterium]|nr:ComEC/Rec2 family competence protein [bacterium]